LSTGEIIINSKYKYMYRFLVSLSLASAIVIMSSCSGNKKEQPAASATTVKSGQTEVVFNEKLQAKVGSWVEKGIDCYGIVIAELADGKSIGKSVKCKVIALKPDMIKLKTLESINLMESRGCDKMGLSYGDTWWEEEGDIFKTREEADAYLKEKGWLIK
jgi:hypothetical protein